MRYFPLFFDLRDARIVVIGGSEEALRKLRLFAKTDAKLEVIAAELHADAAQIKNLNWIAKSYDAKLLDGAALVISADNDLNAAVSQDAQVRSIPVNAVDNAALSTFILPAIVDRDPVVVAIGTEGAAPVLAQNIRAKIDALLPLSLGTLAKKAANLRELVAEKLAHGLPRRAFWSDFFFGSVAEASQQNDPVAYELALGDSLFNHAQSARPQVSHLQVLDDLDLLTLRDQRLLMNADYIVHHADTSEALLEMARRDAVRLLPHQIDLLEGVSGNVLHLISAKPKPSPFPAREDLTDQLLRIAQ